MPLRSDRSKYEKTVQMEEMRPNWCPVSQRLKKICFIQILTPSIQIEDTCYIICYAEHMQLPRNGFL